MSDLLTPTDEAVLQMAAASLRSLGKGTTADELDRVSAKLENAFVEARERGYDDAKSAEMPSSKDLEADFRKWLDKNPHADLRSAWIAGLANERWYTSLGPKTIIQIEAAQQVVDAVKDRLNEIEGELKEGAAPRA